MGAYPIVVFGHPALIRPARELCFDGDLPDDLQHLTSVATGMALSMAAVRGVGLAAPQVAMGIRLCIVAAPGKKPTVLINPRVVDRTEGTESGPEGCLSIPGWVHHVARPLEVTVAALGIDGQPMLFDAEGVEARILCHEVDHLDGRLIVDHGSRQQKRAFGRWLNDRLMLGAA